MNALGIRSMSQYFNASNIIYDITEVFAKRFINCNGNGRGAVKELIIRNYT